MTAAVIGDIVYGMHIDDIKHPYIIAGQEAIEGLDTARAPGAYLTEFVPILKYIPAWVPGAAARKLGNYYKPIVDKMRDEPYDEIKEDVVSFTDFLFCISVLIFYFRRTGPLGHQWRIC